MIPGIGEEALAILGSGAYFGEMEYIDRDLPRAARVTIHESTVLHCFGFQELDELMSVDRDLALAISMSMLKTFSRRLRATNDKVSAMFAMAKF
jgi:CRP-like cAMP-binding protein